MSSLRKQNKKANEWAFFRLKRLGLYENEMSIDSMVCTLKKHYGIRCGSCLRVVVGKITGDYYEKRKRAIEKSRTKNIIVERYDTRKGIYQLYLKTPQWKKLRALALDRDKVCQQCGEKDNLQVHHMKYPVELGTETIEWLIVLCLRCHSAIHKI
jgi:hypothetical protein